MSTNPEQQVDPRVLEQKRQQINRLVEEVSKLSEANLNPPDFFAEFLQRLLTALAAPAGAIWGRTVQGNLQLWYQINYREVGLHEIENGQASHDELLRQAAQEPKPRLVPPHSGVGANGDTPGPANLTRFVVLLVPIIIEKQVAGLVEVWQDPDRSPQAQRGFLQFMVDLAEYAAAFLRNTQLRQMVGREQLWTQLEAFSRQIHGSLNPREVAYMVVNEARRLIQCDRVSVATRLGSATKVEAISGADVIEKRSSLVQTMRALFDQVLIWGERLTYTGTKDDTLPPKVIEALDAYLAESNSKLLIIMPMKDEREAESKRPCRSAMMVESFEPTSTLETLSGRMDVVVKHSAPALYNSLEYKRLPFRWALTPIANVKDSLRGKPGAIAAAISAGVLVLIFLMIVVPYPLRMSAKGQMTPELRRNVYPQVIGRIVKVKVTTQQPVSKDQELVLIQDDELTKEMATLQEQMGAAQRTYNYYKEQVSSANISPELRTNYVNEMIKQDSEFRRADAHYKILLQRARNPREAVVPSPITGIVVSFEPVERLEGRIVKPGEPIMQIADPEGPWELLLRIPESHVGHIRDALNRLKKPTEYLSVDLMISTHPDRTFKGRLYASGLSGEATTHGNETILEARVQLENVPSEELSKLPVGTEAKAMIRCGPAPVGYVLFYELWEFFYERVWFPLTW